MSTRPFTFTLGIADFDRSQLPEGAREPGSEQFEVAVARYFEDRLAANGGRVTVAIEGDTLTVSWLPADGAASPLDYSVELLQRGDYAAAMPILEELLRIDPEDPRALFNLGMACSDTGRIERATELLEKASRLGPPRASVYVALGVAYFRGDRPAEAAKALRYAIKLDATDGYAYRNLAAIEGNNGNLAEAERLFRKAVELLPRDQQAAAGLARTLLAADRVEDADAALGTAIGLAPDTPLAEILRADRSALAQKGFRASGPRPDAMAYCLSALELFDELPLRETKEITFEIAMLGRSGLDVGDPERKYTLKAIPNKTFSGLQLVSMMYVGLKRIDPKLDAGFDLSAEYAAALSLRRGSDRS